MRTARQIFRGVHRHEHGAGRVTFVAVACTIDQVFATIPAVALGFVGHGFGLVETEIFPGPKAPAHDWQGEDLMGRHGIFDGGQGGEIGLDVEHVFHRHVGIGCIGKGRDDMAAITTDTLLHGIDELDIGPLAKAGFGIRRQVGRIECSHRRMQGRTTSRNFLVNCRSLGRKMAGMAAAGIVKLLAVFQVGSVCRDVSQRQGARDGQHPENSKTQRYQQRQAQKIAFGEKLDDGLLGWHAIGFVAALASSAESTEGCLECSLIGSTLHARQGSRICSAGCFETSSIRPDFCLGFGYFSFALGGFRSPPAIPACAGGFDCSHGSSNRCGIVWFGTLHHWHHDAHGTAIGLHAGFAGLDGVIDGTSRSNTRCQ